MRKHISWLIPADNIKTMDLWNKKLWAIKIRKSRCLHALFLQARTHMKVGSKATILLYSRQYDIRRLYCTTNNDPARFSSMPAG